MASSRTVPKAVLRWIRGKGSSNPLLDTGTLRNSVDWEVAR